MIGARLALFLFGFLWALAQVPLGLHGLDSSEEFTVAVNLASSGQFRDPFSVPSGPTAHVPPVYPSMIAAVLWVFSLRRVVVAALTILNAIFLGLGAAFLPTLSRKVYGSAIPGIAGGILLAISSRLMVQWEAPLASVLLLVTVYVLLDRGALAGGLLAGASILTIPVSLPSIAIFLLRRGWRFALYAAIPCVLVCLPWMIRNAFVVGTFALRDNFGMELDLSNADDAAAELAVSHRLQTTQPRYSTDEAESIGKIGEVEYNRRRMRTALDWIRSHPAGFARLSVQRIFYYWFPSLRQGWQAYPYCVITILGALGAWLGRKNRTALLIAGVAIVYSLTFTVIHTDVRHRFPSLWMTALLAGYSMERMAAPWRLRRGGG